MLRGLSNMHKDYLAYVLHFFGVGFISGSVVHFPTNPLLYSGIMTVGAVLFIFGTLEQQKKNDIKQPITLVAQSLLLVFGIGLMSGSIQHFVDTPRYAALLIPLGLVMSYNTFFWQKNGWRTRIFVESCVIALLLAIVLFIAADFVPVKEMVSHH